MMVERDVLQDDILSGDVIRARILYVSELSKESFQQGTLPPAWSSNCSFARVSTCLASTGWRPRCSESAKAKAARIARGAKVSRKTSPLFIQFETTP